MDTESQRPSPTLERWELGTVNEAAARMLDDLDLSTLTKETYRHGLNALVRYLHLSAGDDTAADELSPCPIDRIQEDTLYGFDRWLREAYPDPRLPVQVAASETTRTSRTYLVAARRLMNWLDLNDLLPAESIRGEVSGDRATGNAAPIRRPRSS
jgi:hypothetical protein